MSKIAYIGVDDVARKITTMYVGINDVAKRIKKAYIGIGDVARPFLDDSMRLLYYGQAGYMYEPVELLAATHTSDHAIFGGGNALSSKSGNYYNSPVVATYDKYLTRRFIEYLNEGRCRLAATHVGDFAIFAGGDEGSMSYSSNVVDAYGYDMTHYQITSLYSLSTCLSATHTSKYAIFAGGVNYLSHPEFNVPHVSCYDDNLVRHIPLGIDNRGPDIAATHIGDKAFFAGGLDLDNYILTNTVEMYDDSLTKYYAASLIKDTGGMSATSNGKRAIFAGGYDTMDPSASITAYAYDSTGSLSIISSLSYGRFYMTATSLGGYSIFAGGMTYPGNIYEYNAEIPNNEVDVYDMNLTKKIVEPMSIKRYNLASTHIGNYALFAGGCTVNYELTNLLEVYAI